MTGARSKRKKKYMFTNRGDKKTAEWKRGLADKVRQYVHQYERMIIFKFVNPRTDLIQDLRKKFRQSLFLMGKNKVLQIGLGRNEEEEFDEKLHKVAEEMVGQRGILFTNKSVEEILEYFNDYGVMVHSRPGYKAPKSITLKPGLLPQFSFTQEPLLRQLGLITRLSQVDAGAGVPELLIPFKVSTKGNRLKPNETRLLKLLGHKDSRFHVRLYCVWERESHEFHKFGLKDDKMVLSKKSSEDDDSDDDIEDMTSDEDVSEDEDEFDDDMDM